MKIEKVVEEFLKLLSQGKVEEALELIVEEAKGRQVRAKGIPKNGKTHLFQKNIHY